MSTVIYAAQLFRQEAQDETPVGAAFTVSAAVVGFVLATLIPLGTALATRLTAGTQKFYWPLGNQAVQLATVLASSDVITSYGHGLAAGHEVIVYDVFGTIPAGLTDETIYFVIATGLTTDAFELSATLGGAAVNITADGEFTFQRIIPEQFGLQGTLGININQITLDSRVI